MEKKSNKLPIVLLVAGCVAGGVIGFTYNKVTTSTEYILAKTTKNMYTETKGILNENQVFSDALEILYDEYKVGLDSNTEHIGLSANYDSAVDTYNFNLSLLGFETGFSLDSLPFTINSNNNKLTTSQEAKINELKTKYNQQLATLVLTSETSNLKYTGDEDFDREITYTVSAEELNLIYTGYTTALREILSEDILDTVEVSAGDDINFNLKEGLIGTMIREQIDKYIDNYIQSKLLSEDVIITLNTKKGVVTKATIDSDDRVLSAYFQPDNLLNTVSTLNYKTADDLALTLEITPMFSNEQWILNLNIYDTTTPSDSFELNYNWDLVNTENNFTITKTLDGEVEEKVYTISGNKETGITVEGDKFDFYLEQSLIQQ